MILDARSDYKREKEVTLSRIQRLKPNPINSSKPRTIELARELMVDTVGNYSTIINSREAVP